MGRKDKYNKNLNVKSTWDADVTNSRWCWLSLRRSYPNYKYSTCDLRLIHQYPSYVWYPGLNIQYYTLRLSEGHLPLSQARARKCQKSLYVSMVESFIEKLLEHQELVNHPGEINKEDQWLGSLNFGYILDVVMDNDRYLCSNHILEDSLSPTANELPAEYLKTG